MKEPAANADLKEIRDAVRQLSRGRSNAVGTVTLSINVTSTVVTAKRILSAASAVMLAPTTANAAAALATTYWIASKDTFTITHANNAQADRTFRWGATG